MGSQQRQVASFRSGSGAPERYPLSRVRESGLQNTSKHNINRNQTTVYIPCTCSVKTSYPSCRKTIILRWKLKPAHPRWMLPKEMDSTITLFQTGYIILQRQLGLFVQYTCSYFPWFMNVHHGCLIIRNNNKRVSAFHPFNFSFDWDIFRGVTLPLHQNFCSYLSQYALTLKSDSGEVVV